MRQSGQHSRYSAAERAEVRIVRFSTFNQEELVWHSRQERWSVAEITETRLYEGGRPLPGSPNDLRLGVSTLNQRCETCGETRECQGHFGHIRLKYPVYHYGFLHFVLQVLKCVCHNCFRRRLASNPQSNERLKRIMHLTQPIKRLNELAKMLGSVNECKIVEGERGCGANIPVKIDIKNYQIVVTEGRKDEAKEIVYTSRKVYNILSGIRQEDAKVGGPMQFLGFIHSRPADLMIHVLAVAPPQIRPSIEMNPEKHAEDDITSAYVRIVSINNELQKSLKDTDCEQRILDMERIIASIMVKVERPKTERPNARHRQTRTIKSLEERLKSKEGRFRQHLMGKRVDFSARSVVSPDPNLALDELGVPEKIANSLTIPEEVTEWNFERLVRLCTEGKVKFLLKPGEDKRTYENVVDMKKIDGSTEAPTLLHYGMIVERCLEYGDYVLFNRQPTLHRMSMMGHKVRILPFNTFRLNLSVCTPYNADFDGDEMNMHVPQSYETLAEIKHITHVPKQIVAPKNNAPVIGIVQDALLGIYLFTMRDTFLTREQVMNLVIWIDSRPSDHLPSGELPLPAIFKPEPLWTGKQIMSLIIPDRISIEIIPKDNDGFRNLKDSSMIIRKGQLLSGALQKEVVGSGSGGLVHSIWLEIGPEATNEFVTTAQLIVNSWMTASSFSLGAADVVPDLELERLIVAEAEKTERFYYDTLGKYRNEDKIEKENLHQRGKKIMNSFEFYLNTNLNKSLDQMAKITSSNVSPYLNNIFKIITAKSKGNETNLTQILSCLGNQNVDGKRLPLGFSRRSLPHYSKDDNSPGARGFVFSSFFKGLSPSEFFFHSMGGREGLSDTAVKTSRTGYIQRKLMKALEDIVIKYDGSVRDSQDNFLQKLYGEDSFAAEFIEKNKLGDATLADDKFKRNYLWDSGVLSEHFRCTEAERRLIHEEEVQLLRCRHRLREVFVFGKENTDIEYYCPINIRRLVRKIQATQDQSRVVDVVHPAFVVEQVERTLADCVLPQFAAQHQELMRSFERAETESRRNELARRKVEFEQESGLELFRAHIRLWLASKIVCERYQLSRRQFQGLLEEIRFKFYQALAPAGEAIGSIAAQSVGEPTTQMTLNTFHLAGVADKNVTLGVPRLQELLDASKKIRTPSTTIFLREKILYSDRNKPEIQKQLGSLLSLHFPERHVRDFLAASRIYFDPTPEASRIGAKTKEVILEQRTPWVISLQFDNKKLTSKESLNEVLRRIDDWNRIDSASGDHCEEFFEITQKIGFMESKEERPELTLRLLENWMEKARKLKKAYQETQVFKFLNEKEQEVKDLFVSGILGIHTVKICGKKMVEDGGKAFRGLRLTSEKMVAEQADREKLVNNEWVVFETDGSNLRACLSHAKIDSRKTYCNDITEIFCVLGIEAARQSFINEFKDILKPYSIYINYRHLSILADWMSTRGVLTAINRNGINRVRDVSIFRKASFEETTDILFSAAVFEETDYLRGVSEKLIFGEPVRLGTRSFDLMINREMVNQYNAKGKRDREVEADSRLNGLTVMASEREGYRTPRMPETPHLRTHAYARSPSIHHPGSSPHFRSPAYTTFSQREQSIRAS